MNDYIHLNIGLQQVLDKKMRYGGPVMSTEDHGIKRSFYGVGPVTIQLINKVGKL